MSLRHNWQRVRRSTSIPPASRSRTGRSCWPCRRWWSAIPDRSISPQREYYPDFDLKLQYGQRDRAPDGMPRDDMVSLTVGLNLPIWRKSRLEPQVAEARAMRSQAQSMLAAQQLETRAALEEQRAIARQSRQSAELYQSTLCRRCTRR